MKQRMSIGLAAILMAIPAMTQGQAGRIIKVPFERGVYYDGPSGLVALPTRVFMPLQDSGWREMLGLGLAARLRAVVPGGYAALAIPDRRPTFYMRGDRLGNQTYLVRGTQKGDHREFRFNRSSDVEEWMNFRNEDLTELEVESLGGDLVRLRPRVDLTAGEYVLVSSLEPRYRAVRLAFDFGVPRATP